MAGRFLRGPRRADASDAAVLPREPDPVRPAAYDFHIDRVTATDIAGWVSHRENFDRVLNVQFALDGVPVGMARADLVRADVERAGRGGRHCGFAWSVPGPVARAASEGQRTIEVLVAADGEKALLTRLTLQVEPAVTGGVRERLGHVLDQAIVEASIAAIERRGATLSRHEPGLYPLHQRMFDAPDGELLSAYSRFTRHRLRREELNPLDGSEATAGEFMRFYLDYYSFNRRPLRVPLSAQEIARLNAPVPLLGVPFKVSRASLSYAVSSGEAGRFFPLSSADNYDRFVTWWSTGEAPRLGVEDCLVPDYYVETLRRMLPAWMGREFAPSLYMLNRFNSDINYHVLDMHAEPDRIIYHVWFLLDAIREPGLLRYMPLRHLSALLTADGSGLSQFDRVIQSVHHAGEALGELFSARHLQALLLGKGFDVVRRQFTFRDAAGNRFEAARFPPATARPADRVPLQLIGPLEKSSGLGQAARASATTLQRAGFTPNLVNFGLDNPAPNGMSGGGMTLGEPRPARVNLIHLNGESVPTAFAYLPDVFTGAYNIGYFFWELSTPALAQTLSLDLLDEIWVATEFGVSIYAPAVNKPVVNVGMSFEPVVVPDRAEARAYLASRLPVRPETFVYLGTFDSFSFLERKNPHGLVDAFRAAFAPDDDVLLVLKTHNRDFVSDTHQALRWDRIVEIAASDPRVVILNETMRFGDLMRLVKGADCYVSLHRSEGWGMGLMEAMALGVPVVTTGYSGNLDFTRPENTWLVDYDLVEPGPREYIFVDRGQVWAEPRRDSAIAQLRAVRLQREERERRAVLAQVYVENHFSIDAQAAKYKTRLDEIFAALGPG